MRRWRNLEDWITVTELVENWIMRFGAGPKQSDDCDTHKNKAVDQAI